jgi:hypothetical protein
MIVAISAAVIASGAKQSISSRHSGAMRSIEPGIHSSTRPAAKWIPGLVLSHHPGMTTENDDK